MQRILRLTIIATLFGAVMFYLNRIGLVSDAIANDPVINGNWLPIIPSIVVVFIVGVIAHLRKANELAWWASMTVIALGLAGTFIGLYTTLIQVDIDSVTEAVHLKPVLGQVITGFGVAIFTSLAGVFFNVWLRLLLVTGGDDG